MPSISDADITNGFCGYEVDSSGRIHSYIIKNKQQKHTQQNYELNELVRKISCFYTEGKGHILISNAHGYTTNRPQSQFWNETNFNVT